MLEFMYSQTSVTIPPRITCFFPVAFKAARNSALSQASTSPFLLINGDFGYLEFKLADLL